MNQKEVELAATNRDLIARRKADMIAARTCALPILSLARATSRRHQRNSDDGHGAALAVKMGPPEGSWF